jgi:tripartite-type tricarboxylate transporter receptor subunit TctC
MNRRKNGIQGLCAVNEKLRNHKNHSLSKSKGVIVVKKFVSIIAVALVFALVLTGGAFASGKIWEKGTPTVIVGFGAGGGTDTSVRPMVALMSKYLGETINVANMPGAASAVAAEHVLGLPGDGYTMFATGSGCFGGFKIKETSDSGWEEWTSWHPFQGPAAILVGANSNLKTFDDVVKALKEGSINMGISGFGNGPHVIMQAIAEVAGIGDINYVTSDGDRNVATAVLAGEVEVGIVTFSSAIDMAQAGSIRAVTVVMKEPMKITDDITIDPIVKVLPGSDKIPDLSETWPICIRRDAPQEIKDKITEAFLWAIKQPEIAEYTKKKGLNIVGLTGDDADRFLSLQISGYSWVLYNAGMAEKSPADFNIPKLADWDWETEKKKLTK